jgi:tetratricopeptide (TPR) repeat protein
VRLHPSDVGGWPWLRESWADPAGHLSNLGIALRVLFGRTGELAALTEAVDVGRAAVAATPTGHPDQAGVLNNLGGALQTLFERTGELAALTEAVDVGRAAVAATPTDHPNQAGHLNNLGGALQVLFERTGELAALTEAVQVGRAVVAATPTDHPDHAVYLNNLGIALQVLFERTGELAALTEAVDVGRAVVAATPTDHPNQAGHLSNLGIALQVLFERTGELAALTEAREAFADAATSPTASIAQRITTGRRLGNAAMLAGEPEAALAAFEAAVELVPQMAPRALSRPDREHGLGQLAGLASEVAAAAVATGRPERAVELLEQTRGLLLGEAIDARSDLTELHRAAPALATEFDDLRERSAALEDAAAGPLSLTAQPPAALTDTNIDVMREAQSRQATQLGEQRRQLAEQWTTLVGRIRATAGLEQFLRPPPIARLHHQASAGPIVVVYVSRRRADALIVTLDSAHPVQVVPLPDLTEDAAYEQANRLWAAHEAAADEVAGRAQREVHAVLGWLWDTITGPVLDYLGITGEDGSRPRIWWCPVGILAYLPLHAAGHYTNPGATPVPRTVLDRATSSYVITLRALEHARAHRDTPETAVGSAVVIAMPTIPEAPDLPGVYDETVELARLLGAPLTLIGAAATYQAVVAALPRHRIAHFACHGLSDWADPAASRLLLADHASAPLTVTALMRLHLANADLAYLSACSTTQTNQALADEAVHLTAAVHLAGYRHVVGTLWSINDTAAARIATDVYTRLTNGGTQPARTEDSAHALAEATRSLRDDYPALPTRWAAHLHLGP